MSLTTPAELDDYIIKLVNKHGWWYTPAPLPDDIQRGELNRCFDNSIIQATKTHGKYTYVEGIAYYQGEAYVHAWLTDGKHAFDPTWVAEDSKGNFIGDQVWLYQGLPFALDMAAMYFISTGLQGILANRERDPELFKSLIAYSKEETWVR